MMMNLFSSFDPIYSSLNLNMIFISFIIGVFMIHPSYWLIKSLSSMMYLVVIETMKNDLKSNIKDYNNFLLLMSLFLFIAINNFMGLIPYSFATMSHISITIPMSLMFWLGIIMCQMMYNLKNFMVHLLPLNTPLVLMPLMVMIEMMSMFIRPLTLSIRLAANITAGHLILVLISSGMMNSGFILYHAISNIQMLLYFLEMAVALIQAYVFTLLICLYTAD